MIALSWSITSSLISVIAADFPPAIIVVFRGVGVSACLTHLRSLLIPLTVLPVGFEPTYSFERRILSAERIPIPPRKHDHPTYSV